MGIQNENSLLLSMAIPMMISMLVQALYNIVDTMFVSKLGQDALTALSLAFPVQNLLIAVGVGTGVGANSFLSRTLGEKNYERANRIAANAVFLSIVSSVVVALLGVFLTRSYLSSFGSSESVIKLGTGYLEICLVFSCGLFGQIMFEKLLQSTGKTAYSMLIQLSGAVINIILDPILIYGYFGFPAMGVKGAASATVFGQVAALCIGIIINRKFNKEIKISVSEIFSPDKRIIQRIYAVGIPSIFMASIGSVMTVALNQTMRVFDSGVVATGQAIFGIYFKLQSFVLMPVFGLNNAMVPIVAYNYGSRNKMRIKKTIRLSIFYAGLIMLTGLLAFQFFPKELLGLFDTGGEDMQNIFLMGVPMLRIISLSFIFAGYCIVAGSVFQALGNGMLSLIVSVCRQLFALVPAAFILAIVTKNINAMWFSFPIAEVVSVIMSAIFMRWAYKKKINPL